MTGIYREVTGFIEASKQAASDSFKVGNRFEVNSKKYECCHYIAKEIRNDENTYIIYIDICDMNHKPFERYEIKAFGNKVEVLVYEIEGRKHIRTTSDANVVVNSISRFFDSVQRFMGLDKKYGDKMTLHLMNAYYESKECFGTALKMKDLEELMTLYGKVERASIFNPHTKKYVDEEEAAERITEQHADRDDVMHVTKIAKSWFMPIFYNEFSPEVIAAVSISKGMIHNLCEWISADIQRYLDEQLMP